jgi:hypothetical protein
MDQDPTPYFAMKRDGAIVHEVYRKAREAGFKRHECLSLIMGVFDLELADAREIGHEIYYIEQSLSSTPERE